MFNWKKSDKKDRRDSKKPNRKASEDNAVADAVAAFEKGNAEASGKGIFNLPYRRSSKKRRESNDSSGDGQRRVSKEETVKRLSPINADSLPDESQRESVGQQQQQREKREEGVNGRDHEAATTIPSEGPVLADDAEEDGRKMTTSQVMDMIHNSFNNNLPLSNGELTEKDSQAGKSTITTDKTDLSTTTLPSSVPSKVNKGRLIKLTKSDAGEFGITLRQFRIPNKGKSDAIPDRVLVVVEPTLESSYLHTEIRAGDALLAVNDVDVTAMMKEDIAKTIARSGSHVNLTVLNMPELSHAILPSASVVTKKAGEGNIAKSEEQVAAEKEWLDKESVWLVHADGIVAAKVLEKNHRTTEDEKGGSTTALYKLRLEQPGAKDVEVEEDSVERANPSQFDRLEDLILLRYLNESSCIHTLQQRYVGSLIHTFAGQDLVIVNPKQSVNIYSEKVIKMFRSCKQEDMPPHVFAVAQSTYRNMLTMRTDQSIVFLGPSGSGKTINYKHTLKYFANALVSAHGNATDERLDAALSAVGSFGNARTALCSNASRFSLLTSMQFDASGQMVGALMQIFLAEKSRVVHQPPGESSFKIFHQLLACQDPKLRGDLLLEDGVKEDNCFFNAKEMARDACYYHEDWKILLASLDTLGITQDEAMGLWSPLAAVIHLGEAGIMINEQTGRPQFANLASAHRAAAVLGTSDEELSRIIFSSANLKMKAVKQWADSSLSVPNSNGDNASIKFDNLSIYSEASILPFEMCIAALRGFAMGLYMESFSALVRLSNRALSTTVKTQTSLHLLDSPGFQNPSLVGAKSDGASFEDLCVNYACEKMHWFKHFTTVTVQQDRYARENIEFTACDGSISNEDTLNVLDKLKLDRSLVKSGNSDSKGLFWMLEDEAAKTNNTEVVFVDKLKSQHHIDRAESVIQGGECSESFTISHLSKSAPVKYSARGWFRMVKEHPVIKMAYTMLTESKKKHVSDMYIGHRSGVLQVEISRHRSMKRSSHSPSNQPIKKNSVFMHLKVQLDTIIDTLRRTNPKFVHCFCADSLTQSAPSPRSSSGTRAGALSLDIPLVRQQFRGMQLLNSMRTYRQGYPEHMPFGEFRRRFAILIPKEERQDDATVLDEKQAVEHLTKQMELDKRSFKFGLSQIFFRAGCLAQFEDARDETLNETIVAFQARCRGLLGRRHTQKLKIQHMAITCVQRNVRKFFAVRHWPWWKLYTHVLPLLDVHRTEQQLQTKTNEVDVLHARITKLETENMDALDHARRLQKKIDELTVATSQANASAASTNELLEQEVVDRLQTEEELRELKERHDALQTHCDQLASESRAPRLRTSTEFADDDSDEDDSLYRLKYKSLARDFDEMKRRLAIQAEEEAEDYTKQRKHVERQLADEKAESEDFRRQWNNTKRKFGKLQAEMEDMKLILEGTQSRNAELEKRQRKFDTDMSKVREDVASERQRSDMVGKEKDSLLGEKITLENERDKAEDELARMRRKVEALETEVESVGRTDRTDSSEVLSLRREARELRAQCDDQEEELDEQAGQIQQLQQTKLKLEMAAQKDRQQCQRDLDTKDEDIEKARLEASRKIKAIEEQLEEEVKSMSDAVKVRRDLERKVFELQNAVDDVDIVGDRRLRKELRRIHILYKDAKHALEQKDAQNVDKGVLKMLRSQLEDAEFTKHVTLKSKSQLESDVKDLQAQLLQMSLGKQEAEDRVFSLTKQLADLQDKMEDDEDDMRDIIKKNKQLLTEISELQTGRLQSKETIQGLLTDKDTLEAKVTTLTNRLQSSENNTVDRLSYDKMETRTRELEERLDVEIAMKTRFENQVNRLKDNSAILQDDRDAIRSKEGRISMDLAKLARQVKDQREEIESLYYQEAEHKRRKEQADSELTVADENIMALKTELHLANKRIRDLQEALEREMMASDGDDDDLDASVYSDDGGSDLRRYGGSRVDSPVRYDRTRRTSSTVRRRDSRGARPVERRASAGSSEATRRVSYTVAPVAR